MLSVPEVQGVGEILARRKESERRQNHRHELFLLDRASGGYHSNESSQVRFLCAAVGVVFDVWSVNVIGVRFWKVGWERSQIPDYCKRVPERWYIVFEAVEVDGMPQVANVVFTSAWTFRGDQRFFP